MRRRDSRTVMGRRCGDHGRGCECKGECGYVGVCRCRNDRGDEAGSTEKTASGAMTVLPGGCVPRIVFRPRALWGSGDIGGFDAGVRDMLLRHARGMSHAKPSASCALWTGCHTFDHGHRVHPLFLHLLVACDFFRATRSWKLVAVSAGQVGSLTYDAVCLSRL